MFRCCPRLTTVTVCLTKLRVTIVSPKYIKYGMITRHSMKFQESPTHLSPGLGATDPNHFDTSQERLFKSLLACSEDQKHAGNHGQLEVGSSVRWWVIGCYWYTVGSIQIIPDWSCIWMYLVCIYGVVFKAHVAHISAESREITVNLDLSKTLPTYTILYLDQTCAKPETVDPSASASSFVAWTIGTSWGTTLPDVAPWAVVTSWVAAADVRKRERSSPGGFRHCLPEGFWIDK